jgi:uroporphyrin-III C-methyltransferase
VKGKVYLVGAGPGDPELLTVKALRLLRIADVILHDDLVSPEVLELIPPTAQLQNVGKRCGTKTMRQEEINFLMVELAGSGLQVVRLKSGDPMIFGRAGEEIDALRQAGIEYEVVPGITSALGAAASTSVPLTDRRFASTLVVTTGHQAAGKDNHDWKQFAETGATMVIYMPGHQYTGVSKRLLNSGFEPGTPCAIVSRATTSQQQVHVTTISKLHRAPRLAAPTLLLVGEVVKLADSAACISGDFPKVLDSAIANQFIAAESTTQQELSK